MTQKLRQYVRRVMQEKGLTVMEVADGSDGEISTDLLDNIRQGVAKDLSDDEVKGLAKGLGQPEEDVRSVMIMPE
jgi:hypothetical protein